jgi:hypothetical protein
MRLGPRVVTAGGYGGAQRCSGVTLTSLASRGRMPSCAGDLRQESRSLETKQPAFGAGRSSGRAGEDALIGVIILPDNLPSSQAGNVVSRNGGAMPACVRAPATGL